MSDEEVSREVYDEITKNVFQLVLNEDKEERNKFNEYINKYYLCKEVEITNEDWNEIKQIMPFIKDLLLQKENDQDLLNLFKTLIPPTIVETLEAAKAVERAKDMNMIIEIITTEPTDNKQINKIFHIFCVNKFETQYYIEFLMNKISSTRYLNTDKDEIKNHLILSIILLKYTQNIKEDKRTFITNKWDTVKTYVDEVIEKNKDNPTAYLYDNREVQDVDNVKREITESKYKGYFVFLFRYLLYSEDKKFKQYFSFDQSK